METEILELPKQVALENRYGDIPPASGEDGADPEVPAKPDNGEMTTSGQTDELLGLFHR
ncbi:MAG: hypothetical protein ABI600_13200 [Luteolibacter sp.]